MTATCRQQVARQITAMEEKRGRCPIAAASLLYYTGPVMTRQTISLDGQWQFWLDKTGSLKLSTFDKTSAYTVSVPAPWQAHEGLRDAVGIGWYRRNFKLGAKSLKDGAVVLHFGAVDYLADVWVNGKKAGSHEGGYLPFDLDVTKLVTPGNNTVVVRVDDTHERFSEIPHGKQSWYGPISGLWQSVAVEVRPVTHITALKLTPHDNQIDAEVVLNRAARNASVAFTVLDPKGKAVGAATAVVDGAGARAAIDVPNARLWDIDSPNLYTVRAALNDDVVEDTCGFRTIESRDGKLWLNDRPVYLRSALDQDYYPDGIYTAPSLEYIEAQFRQAKAMGLNSLRIHIKIGDPRYYIAADRVGLLIWTEMPNWQVLTAATRERAKATFEGMLARDWNRPSIVIRSIINEAWGLDIYDPANRQWMADTYDWLKAQDSSRLVVDNSACHSNFHVVTDIDDMHIYYTIPDHYTHFREWTKDYAARPKWTFTPQLNGPEERRRFLQGQWKADWITPAAENRRRGDEPLIVSEFGNWGLPDVEKLRAYYGGDPWWFETGLQHGEGQVYPQGIDERFDLYRIDRAFPTLKALTDASQDMEFLALKFELEEMRRHASIQGYVITEFTDLHWECNGLLDMVRNPKSFYKTIGDINADDVILPGWTRVTYWEGERVEVNVGVSQYSTRNLANSRIEWSVPGTDISGVVEKVSPALADVIDAGVVSFKAPAVASSRKLKLEMKLVTNGKVTARNHLDLYVFPRASAVPATTARVYAPEHTEALRALKYRVVDDIAQADVVVTGHLTEAIREYVMAGGKVLWLAETDDAQQSILHGTNAAHVGPRAGTSWSGDWASNFNWLCQDVLFKDIPTDGRMDFAFADLTPEHVIHGVHPYSFADDVHAGLFLGWIHKAVALVAERQVGAGRLLISTFRLKDHLTAQPVAAVLLRDMLAHTAR
jgi:Glycosyl hydrolases family 2, sugar binding domain/Glycosyl hydrolases family 2/Glycosyl hydrolases family 2, TIM barrel domain